MSHLTHLLRADLRRHRLLLVAWAVIVAGSTAFSAAMPMIDLGIKERATLDLIWSLLLVTQPLLAMLLVAQVIQTHPLIGSTAFWMTRPIPPYMLLASKGVLLFGVVVMVQAAAQLVFMAVYMVPPREALGVTAWTLLMSCLPLLIAAILASMTGTLARFATVVVGLLVLVILGLMIVTALVIAFMEEDGYSTAVTIYDPTPGLVLLILAIGGGTAMLATIYRTRSRLLATGVGTIGAVLAVLVSNAWPWPLLAQPRAFAPWVTPARPVIVAGNSAPTVLQDTTGTATRRWRSVQTDVWLDGIEEGWSATIRLIEARLSAEGRGELVTSQSDARRVFSVSPTPPTDASLEHPIRRALRHVLGVTRLADGHPLLGGSTAVMCVPDTAFQRFVPAAGRYRGRFEVTLTHHEIEARLPLTDGAWHQQGSQRVVVERITRAPGVVTIELRSSQASSPFGSNAGSWNRYYLRNPEKSEAMEGSWSDSSGGIGSLHFLPFAIGFGSAFNSGFVAQRLVMSFPPTHGLQSQRFPIDEPWLRGAELVVVRDSNVEAFELILEIPDFSLRPPPTDEAND